MYLAASSVGVPSGPKPCTLAWLGLGLGWGRGWGKGSG